MNRMKVVLTRIWEKIPIKVLASACILLYAIVMAVCKRRIDGWFCMAAVIFCFLGDISFNHRREHSKQTMKDFSTGMVMFFIAHLFYSITYFFRILEDYQVVLDFGGNWILFAAVDIMVLFVVSSFLQERMDFGEYENSVIAYMGMISTSFCMSLAFSVLTNSIDSLAAIGGALLIISDVTIAFEKFAFIKTPFTRKLVWTTYILGQILMITFA